MKITPVDSNLDLFYVENFYPTELLNQFLNTNHLDAVWKKEDMQMQYPRRRLLHDRDSVYAKMGAYVNSNLNLISGAIGLKAAGADTGFWLDEPGFSMDSHLDNGAVFASMQIFLNNNNLNLGTVFYNRDNSIRFKPEYKINTGYIMINGPYQIHGMGNKVPENSYRICSYTWFYPKT